MRLIDNKALQKYIVFNLVLTAIIGFSTWYLFGLLDLKKDFEPLVILFLSCLILNCVITISCFFVLKKKGVDVYTVKNMLIITLAPLPNILIPIWIDPKASFNAKIRITVVIYLFTIVSFYAYHYGGKRLRKQVGIETEEDRREIEREEKAKKEKDAKGKVG